MNYDIDYRVVSGNRPEEVAKKVNELLKYCGPHEKFRWEVVGGLIAVTTFVNNQFRGNVKVCEQHQIIYSQTLVRRGPK